MPKLVDRDLRREELGQAVLRLLTRDGASKLTFRAIAEEAGWSVGVVQHYFRDRDDLVSFANELAFERAERRIDTILESKQPPLVKLQKVLEQGLPLDRSRLEEWYAWLAFWNRAVSDADLGVEQAVRYTAWRHLVRELLEHAESQGDLRPELDVGLEAEMLVAFVDGIGLQALFEPERLSRRTLVRLLTRTIERIAAPTHG
jgi:AcrR family transcriptional regulator